MVHGVGIAFSKILMVSSPLVGIPGIFYLLHTCVRTARTLLLAARPDPESTFRVRLPCMVISRANRWFTFMSKYLKAVWNSYVPGTSYTCQLLSICSDNPISDAVLCMSRSYFTPDLGAQWPHQQSAKRLPNPLVLLPPATVKAVYYSCQLSSEYSYPNDYWKVGGLAAVHV